MQVPRISGLEASRDAFDQLRHLDEQLKDADERAKVRGRGPSTESEPELNARRDRGHLSTVFGMPTRGVSDLERVVNSRPKDMVALALLAEARRVHARDILLGGAEATRQQVVDFLSTKCVVLFDKCIESSGDLTDRRRAWLYAHRAAALTLSFTMTREKEVFSRAVADFEAALKIEPNNVWARQFEAFLYAVRGDEGDAKIARAVLPPDKEVDSLTQSSLNRSRAMLFSYDGEDEEAVRAGLQAAAMDSEDSFALYFAAAALKRLQAEGKVSAPLVESALESARVRAMNAISQSTAILAAVGLLQGRPEVADEFLNRLCDPKKSDLEVRPDLETLAMMSRDPTWKALAGDSRFQQLMKEGAPPCPYTAKMAV